MAVDEGAGLYVEYTSSDFVLAILNRGCFIQYFSQLIDVPPSEWVSSLFFGKCFVSLFFGANAFTYYERVIGQIFMLAIICTLPKFLDFLYIAVRF